MAGQTGTVTRHRSWLTPGYESPTWLDVAPVEGRSHDFAVYSQSLGDDVHCRVWSPDARPARCRCWSPTTGRSTTRSRAHPLRGAMIARGDAAAVPGRAARARRPRRVVLGVGRSTAARWPTTSSRRCAGAFAVRGAPVGMGASLGGAGHAARPAPLPARVRRAVPAVRELLRAALRRPGVGASRATPRIVRFVRAIARATARYAIPCRSR